MSDLDDRPPPSEPPSRSAGGPKASRTTLGALVVLLVVAVLFALWFLVFAGDDDVATDDESTPAAVPTPLPIPTSTPTPAAVEPTEPAPTAEPTAEPTPVPEGFEACDDDRAPLLSSTYIVDTVTTPLNQRADPSVDGALVGSFDPGQTGLTFNGQCVVNLADGYVWWQIDNGSEDVWVASRFVTPRQ